MRDPNAFRDGHSGEPDPADLRNSPRNLNRHWYAAITGGMPLRWYIAALCCGTIVILLGWYPLGIADSAFAPARRNSHYELKRVGASGRRGTSQ